MERRQDMRLICVVYKYHRQGTCSDRDLGARRKDTSDKYVQEDGHIQDGSTQDSIETMQKGCLHTSICSSICSCEAVVGQCHYDHA
jgi:hypothetical protein